MLQHHVDPQIDETLHAAHTLLLEGEGWAKLWKGRVFLAARLLFVHRHGPGQFVHLAAHFARVGHAVSFLCESCDRSIPGVRVLKHRVPAPATRENGAAVDYQLRLGQEVAHVMEALRRQEGVPDAIVGHVGWGSLLFAKDVFPEVPVLGYCEFFYRSEGADVGFDPATPRRPDDAARLKARNFAQVSTLLGIEAALSPTEWQRSLYPDDLRKRIGVVHDGIDLSFCRPDTNAALTLPNGRVVRPGEKIVTYAARNLEPYRGFPQFMRAAARLARADPDVTFLVAGGDASSYGPPPGDGRSWREVMMGETGLDPARIHFLGTLAHADLIRLFQVSSAHVYLSYPFVLSWSMLEAMACGVVLVGSATPPVQEFVREGINGRLVPFFDADALAATMGEALRAGDKLAPLREAARRTVERRANLPDCIRRQSRAIGALLR